MYFDPDAQGVGHAIKRPAVADGKAKRRKNLFGRPDLAAVYYKARDFIVENGIFRMVAVSELGDGTKSIVICNLWRIDRYPDGTAKTLEFLLNEQRWVEVTTLEYWPNVPFFPVHKTQSLAWWRDIARAAIWKALMAAGYGELPKSLTPFPDVSTYEDYETIVDKMRSSDSSLPRPEMPPQKMAYALIGRYLGKKTKYDEAKSEYLWSTGFLKPEVMVAGARALRAAIFEHLSDKELLSAILAIEYKIVTLRDYLSYAWHAAVVRRVAQERRNLLPLLPQVSSTYWHRKDLFSRKLWVRDGRRNTVVDYSRFSVSETKPFSSFASRSAFRWLCKAQLTVIRAWSLSKSVTVLENLAQANISVRIPAVAWSHLMDPHHRIEQLGVGVVAQRLYRAFAVHCAAIWKEQGFAALKLWLRSSQQADFGIMADWLVAEGLRHGFPNRQSTWGSLLRACDDWHERVAIENVERSVAQNLTWESLVPEKAIDDIVVTPLNSSREVALEGYRQHHCVGGYAQDCASGYYRIYTVVEPDGTRSTLGLWLESGDKWSIEQHRGKFNGAISPPARSAGEELLRLYQKAHREQIGKTKAA